MHLFGLSAANLFVREKIESQKRGEGEMIRIHNIYPCPAVRTNLSLDICSWSSELLQWLEISGGVQRWHRGLPHQGHDQVSGNTFTFCIDLGKSRCIFFLVLYLRKCAINSESFGVFIILYCQILLKTSLNMIFLDLFIWNRLFESLNYVRFWWSKRSCWPIFYPF